MACYFKACCRSVDFMVYNTNGKHVVYVTLHNTCHNKTSCD